MKGKENRKVMKLGIFSVIVLMAMIVGVSANDNYEMSCLIAGEQIDFGSLCNPAMRTISGPSIICVHTLDNGKVCPAVLNKCNNLGLSCTTSSVASIDQDPPVMEISFPINAEVYSSRRILMDIELDERATIAYTDNGEIRQRWRSICRNCDSFNRFKRFREGLNDITIRATDRGGNTVIENVTFIIDSRAPRVLRNEPRRGFASGTFYVSFMEANPVNVEFKSKNSE